MDVSCIIPLYNGLALTRAMLDSLRATLPPDLAHEILFVDDGSSDGTREWLAGLNVPSVRVLLNERNLGYAGANNRGAKAASGDWLALLNNDLLLEPGWLEPMLAAGRSLGARAGLVGNVQRRVADGSVDHAGIVVTTRAKLAHVRRLPPPGSPMSAEVFAVTGACCLVRRATFLDAGGFDEAFHNGGEDVDLALRLRASGRKTIVVFNSSIRHHVSASRGPTARRDEENSRLLFSHWRGEILRETAIAWDRRLAAGSACAQQTTAADDAATERHPSVSPSGIESPHPLAAEGAHEEAPLVFAPPGGEAWCRSSYPTRVGDSAARLLRRLGLSSQPSPAACLLAESAVAREEARWRTVLDGVVPGSDAPEDYRWERLRVPDAADSVWIDRWARIVLPAGKPLRSLHISGFLNPPQPGKKASSGPLGLRIAVNGLQTLDCYPMPPGEFTVGIGDPASLPGRPTVVDLELRPLSRFDLLDWLGRRLAALSWLPKHWRKALRAGRHRSLCRRLRLSRIVADDEAVLDFRNVPPLAPRLRLRGEKAGLNIVGWLRAELGIGESARCMVRAADAAGLPSALVDLRVPCLARMGDDSFTARLGAENPHPVNVVHFDPPVARDLAHHHGPRFFGSKYNIAYWAWELPEFPEAWVPSGSYVDEVWCPSEFVRAAIASRLRRPVRVMPHAIEFAVPSGDCRSRFSLPSDRCLFLFLYDLNSYQERKNPLAVIEAYRRAFPDEADVALVLKTHNPERNREAFARLLDAVKGLRQVRIIADTLSRSDVHALEAACDVFVSLHRSEGFGLAVAEAMYLGKPVISTDWSATAEFVTADTGCPVRHRLITLRESHGPYAAGQTWADPDVDHAADWMRRLRDDAALRTSLGRAAAAAMRRDFSPVSIGARYRARLEQLGLR